MLQLALWHLLISCNKCLTTLLICIVQDSQAGNEQENDVKDKADDKEAEQLKKRLGEGF
jgi:hypothetical protein